MASERIRIGNDYYLLATALPSRTRRLVLNHGDSFAILNETGDVPLGSAEPFGLFRDGTRFLDRFELRLNGGFPLLLSAELTDDASEQVTHITNPDQIQGGDVVVQRDTVAVERRKVLVDGALFETLHVRNYGAAPLDLLLTLLFTADFVDIFELRGVARSERGQMATPHVENGRVVLGYRGLDGVDRSTELHFQPRDWRLEPESAQLALRLSPGAHAEATIGVSCRVATQPDANAADATHALTAVRRQREADTGLFAHVLSSHEGFNEWVSGSLRDLALLRAHHGNGDYVYAGVPWFATVFGRDGLLTSLETLAFAPEMAAGTLRRLAALQGRVSDARRDEEPGKILHEMRLGEMAATGEIPFGRYYGSVDATPLFVALLAAYADRTADLDLVRALWPAARAATEWIQRSLDPRGYLSYLRRTPKGLVNQGWKDSHESISHADGRLADAPIALCEVQGYVYAALRGMASLASRLGDATAARTWESEAQSLRARFARDFWLEDEGTYALALDRDGRPCEVVASNAGHCLLSGIAEPAHAARVVARLMAEDCFCGWGVRTLSSQARRYNPMSYHNGSVWPHDNAMIAAGFARYGLSGRAADVLTALFEVSLELKDRRLPELFCGFARRQRDHPVPYPVACRPQAWAAGAVFLLIQAVLGLSIDAWRRRVTISQATLPPWLEFLELRGLRVRDARVDIRVVRGRRSAALEVVDKQGEVDVLVHR